MLAAVAVALSACSMAGDDIYAPEADWQGPNSYSFSKPTNFSGLVTVKADDAGRCFLQFNHWKLLPRNNQEFTIGKRALADFTIYPEIVDEYYVCTVGWLEPLDEGVFVPLAEAKGVPAGGDGLDIDLTSEYTTLQDGFLSLMYSTWWGEQPVHHDFYLLSGVDPEDPFTLELRQDSHSDKQEVCSEGLVCFDINSLSDTAGTAATITLKWTKLDGTEGIAHFGFKARE